MRHGRGEAKAGTRDRLREGPKETIDAPFPELPEKRVEAPTNRVATRDVR
jgi:hypothetical protein